MPRKPKAEPLTAVLDFETDPFLYGRVPKPFACGLYYEHDDDSKPSPLYVDFWGDDCVAQLLGHLTRLQTPLRIYAHNGGKFDFHFLLASLDNPITIIDSRIIKAKLGVHELRDSWAIIPVSLKKANQKTVVDYAHFEREVRELHKPEIRAYLLDDCSDLFVLVDAFVKRFGPRLTIAGTAGKELRKLHPQIPTDIDHDTIFRPYYFGGRVQAFKKGVVKGAYKIYDVNSMYPFVMKNFRHPLGRGYISPHNLELDHEGWIKGFEGWPYFAEVECEVTSKWGVLPLKRKGDALSGLEFPQGNGRFRTTSHELRAAIACGIVCRIKLLSAHIPQHTQTFDAFVDTFVAEKTRAKISKDKIGETFSKLVLNSAYGRFGIDPREFYEYWIGGPHDVCEGPGFEPYEVNDQYSIWRKPKYEDDNDPDMKGFEDVAIATSVTSAARAVLMMTLHTAIDPIYCDTDSIVCKGLRGVRFSDTELGAWKLEGEGDTVALAGKKLYAVFAKGEVVKYASKGVKISPDEILSVAQGHEVTWRSEAPNFSLSGPAKFIVRRIKSTL